MASLQAVRTLRADPSRTSCGPIATEATSSPAGPPAESSTDLTAKMSKLKSLADADKALISTLQAKIEDHKKELEHRAVTIAAIQRNFENLSSVAHADRQELSALREAEVRRRDESLAAAEELERLRAEVFELRKVREVAASTQDELAAAAKRAAGERGRLDSQLAASEQRYAALEKRFAAETARADEAARRAAEAEVALQQALRRAQQEAEGERQRAEAATQAAGLRLKGEEAARAALDEAKAAAASYRAESEALRERAAAAEARVRGAEEAAKAAQEEARRAGTLASREIAELHEKLRAARQSGSDAASEAVQRAEALLRESQAREAAQKKRADELTEHMLKLSERLEASDATIKQLKLLKAELEATAQAREADIESVRAQMVAHAEAAGKRDGERIAAISRLEAALGTANAEVHAAREQLGRGVEEAQRRMHEAGEALETARAREAAAAAEELRAARE